MSWSFEQGWLLLLSVLLGVGYLLGLMLNRRLGRQAYRWLQAGLRETFHSPLQGRWLGSMSTGARLAVTRPPAPFRSFEAAFLLQMRELVPLWLWNRLRGKGDQLVLRASLRHGVPVEWEIGPERGPAPGAGFAKVTDLPLPAGWAAWARPASEAGRGPDWRPLLRFAPAALLGLSLRRAEPHLVVRLNLQQAQMFPATDLLLALQQAWRPSASEDRPSDA